MEEDTPVTTEETAVAVETAPVKDAAAVHETEPAPETPPADPVPEIPEIPETPAEAPEPMDAKNHALEHTFIRARALDREISEKDEEITEVQRQLKALKEERELLVTELRRCIRNTGQGVLFPLPLEHVDETTGEISEPEEAKADEDLAEPPLKLEDLRFTQARVEKVLHEVVEIYGERKVLWALLAEPDRPEKIGMPLVKKLEETLAAEKERIPDEDDPPTDEEE